MTSLLDHLLQTLRTLRAHALRFALTSLGIFWGAAMLTYLSAESAGRERAFKEQLERTGPKVVWSFAGVVLKDRVGERGARRLEIEYEDVERLLGLELVQEVSREINLWNAVVRAGSRTRIPAVVGIDAAGLRIRNFEAESGRTFTDLEAARGERVAFLGHQVKLDLFGRGDAVGHRVEIEGVPFQVVGVARRKGDQLMYMGAADDQIVAVPAQAAVRWLSHTDKLDRFLVAPRTRAESDAAAAAIRLVTGLHHDFAPDDELAMNFVNVQEVWQILDTLFGGLRVFLVATGLVTLLVGAVGVMNIMLVVVGERTQEVGLRKAIGATDRAVFTQFLSEAAAVSTLSGAAGCVTGLALLQLVRMTIRRDDPASAMPLIDPGTISIVVLSLVLVGIVAGIVPAIRAARIAPAESLRAG
jgi:putative ABC transport system permease protein